MVLRYPDLQKQFFTHSGPAIQILQLEPRGYFTYINTLLTLLPVHCLGLKQLTISDSGETEIRHISADFYVHLHALLTDHPGLQDLTLYCLEELPLSVVQIALAKLKSLTLGACTVAEDVHDESLLAATRSNVSSFECYNTPLPSQLCALVTNVTMHSWYWEGMIPRYTNLSDAALYHSNSRVDSNAVNSICSSLENFINLEV